MFENGVEKGRQEKARSRCGITIAIAGRRGAENALTVEGEAHRQLSWRLCDAGNAREEILWQAQEIKQSQNCK